MPNIKCPQCGLTNWETAIECKRCQLNLQQSDNHQQPFSSAGGFGHASQDSYSSGFDSSQSGYAQPHSFGQSTSSYQASSQAWSGSQGNHQPPRDLKQGLAITSMVLGILAYVLSCLGGFLLAPIGLVLGIVSLVKANRHPNTHGGKSYAITGVILNAILTLMFPMILAIAIPNLLASRRFANEGSAISTIRNISEAEATYQSTIGKGNCGDIDQLINGKLLQPFPFGNEKNGYRFSIQTNPATAQTGAVCEVLAVPVKEAVPGAILTATGSRSFYASSMDRWKIHFSRIPKKNATINDEAIGDR